MNVKRLVFGTAIVVAALGAGGVAYAASNDPAPEQGYVTVDNDATTPSPSPSAGTGDGTTGRNGIDCPEKNGSDSTNGTSPSQPAQPEQNPAGNA
jgi:hypothetical protein